MCIWLLKWLQGTEAAIYTLLSLPHVLNNGKAVRDVKIHLNQLKLFQLGLIEFNYNRKTSLVKRTG